jgi:hypothetical protein
MTIKSVNFLTEKLSSNSKKDASVPATRNKKLLRKISFLFSIGFIAGITRRARKFCCRILRRVNPARFALNLQSV